MPGTHTEQDFRGRVKPVLRWSPTAGAGAASPPKPQSMGQPSPASAEEGIEDIEQGMPKPVIFTVGAKSLALM